MNELVSLKLLDLQGRLEDVAKLLAKEKDYDTRSLVCSLRGTAWQIKELNNETRRRDVPPGK